MNDIYFDDNRHNWNDRARLHEEAGYGIEDILKVIYAIFYFVSLNKRLKHQAS
ncbi:hypothetical protein [Streptococcus mutans]|uniref:hypothetical protein n=1 Tax=Streptococcus mutans TaxID=1309 RepID=UPI00214DC760|nr:hypothetical protein [Streptococcus mutans]MCY7129216.1 hypothetical protein [Streptococcus mutans]